MKAVKVLLIVVLFLSPASFGSGPRSGKIEQEHPVNPHLDVPKNCKRTIQPDDSVLLTCECEACGKEEDDAVRKSPDPWNCRSGDGGVYCTYDLDPVTTGERKQSHI